MVIVVAIAAVVVIAVVAIAVAVISTSRNARGDAPDGNVMGFDNPMYAGDAAPTSSAGNSRDMYSTSPPAANPGYMDVAAFSGSSSGYMDVAGVAGEQDGFATGYVDVSPTPAAENGAYVDIGADGVDSFDV